MAVATTSARASAGCEVDYSVSSQWPGGFGANTVIAASAPNKNDMFEADNVSKVDGSNTCLMVVEAIGSDARRLFHSWISNSLTGKRTSG